jgi:phosphoribosyl-ATP pyrophosphohydrolase
MSDFEIIGELYEIIQDRKTADPEKSYCAKLFKKGRQKIAQKLGEEAVETIVEAVSNNKQKTIEESSDLLFHLLVLWADMGITPEKVMQELAKRKGTSGIDEKNSRKET